MKGVGAKIICVFFSRINLNRLVLVCYKSDFMTYLSDDNQADIIEASNSISTYLDDLNIDNPYFEGMVNQIFPPKLLIIQTPRPPFRIYNYLLLTVLFPPKFMINAMDLRFSFF